MKHTNRRLLLVLDAQGGGMGAQLIKRLAPALPPDCDLLAVGTNVLATNAMLKAGAPRGATGENAVVYNAARADVIVGPIGIVIADALLGEITPRMAQAVAQSPARRILIPVNHCDNIVVGVEDLNLGELVQDAVRELKKFLAP